MTKTLGAIIFVASVAVAVLGGYLEWQRADQMNKTVEVRQIIARALKEPYFPPEGLDLTPRWQSSTFFAICGISAISAALGLAVMIVGRGRD